MNILTFGNISRCKMVFRQQAAPILFYPYTNLHDTMTQKLKYLCPFIFPFSGLSRIHYVVYMYRVFNLKVDR